ncbi:MAG: ArsA family ATPase [Chloroflexi bacterium]|nr:ArsA family ATPase [Chloroflexota bacterium]
MRIILYTGKGGVGKTSVAAATGLVAAKMGYRTLVMSTDAAHSLADSFDTRLGSSPTPLADNLWGQEIDIFQEMNTYWGTVKDWLRALMQWQGADDVVAEELAVLPGMEELVGLLNINRYYEEKSYDLLIVDCAPTGETLRLLSFPDMARWYMRRLFPIERKVALAIAPVAKGILNLPIPDARVFDTIQTLYGQLERMRNLLTNPDHSSVRLVVNPEKMVIREAQRTFTYLNVYGYHTDLVVCNRVIPDAVGDRFFDKWKEAQKRHLVLINESFSPVPILTAPLMEREVVGLETLETMGNLIFQEQDPTMVFYVGQSQTITREDSFRVLRVPLSFVTKDEISLMQSGDELIIQAGRHRRNIILPRILVGLGIEDALLEGSSLRVRFRKGKS